MLFFRKEKSQLSVALDVGSQAIKGIVFSSSMKKGREASGTDLVLQARKRVALQMPSHATATRIVEVLHSLLAGIIKEFGRIPAKVTVGFGPSLAEYHLEAWDVESPEKTHLHQKELTAHFNRLFEQHNKDGRAMIASPAGIEVNGYAIPPATLHNTHAHDSLFLLGGICHDIRFRTLVSYFPSEIGVLLTDMKQMLGGVPIEFVPLASAYGEALTHRLGVQHALLIDIGWTSTLLVMLKDGTLVQTAAFPFGVFHIVQEIRKQCAIQFDAALDRLRQYSQGRTKGRIQSSFQRYLVLPLATWSQCLREGLDSLYPLGPLTGQTYLAGGGAYLPEFRSYIEQGEWLKNLSYTGTPRVTVLEGKSLFAENTLEGFLQGPEDAGLASVLWYGMLHE